MDIKNKTLTEIVDGLINEGKNSISMDDARKVAGEGNDDLAKNIFFHFDRRKEYLDNNKRMLDVLKNNPNIDVNRFKSLSRFDRSPAAITSVESWLDKNGYDVGKNGTIRNKAERDEARQMYFGEE